MLQLSAEELWGGALEILRKEVSEANYNTWLKDIQSLHYQGTLFIIGVPNAFTAEWLETRLLSLLKKALRQITGQELDIEIRLGAAPEQRPPPLFTLNPRYTFDTFVPGPCNQLAYTSAKRAVLDPHRSANPLFIFSDTGLGKTHLLQAIAHLAWGQGLRPVYVHAEDFTNDFVTSLERRQGQDFRRRYRTLDLLILDDIHFLAGKVRTEEGFLFTFNELYNRSRQIVVSSDCSPQNVPLGAELRSRFQGGLATQLEPPDRQTSLCILQQKALQLQLTIAPEALEFIATEAKSNNIRELEGYLHQIQASAEANGRPVDSELIQSVIRPGEPPPTQRIIQAVAQYLHLPVAWLLSRHRQPKAVLGRQLIIFLLRERLGLTMLHIGNLLGLAKSTVIYNYEKIAQGRQRQPGLEQALRSITAQLELPGQ